MCKWSDPFSKRVLIGRGLDHNSLETLKSQRKNASSDYSVLKARPSKKHWTKYNMYVILGQSDRSVSMTVRFHLFPFRTQKLSSLVPKIVRWKRRVKIGSRRLEQKTLQKKFWGVFCCLNGFRNFCRLLRVQCTKRLWEIVSIKKRHIGVVSDRRNKNGVPYVIYHNDPWQTAYEQDILEERTDIVGHYRISE